MTAPEPSTACIILSLYHLFYSPALMAEHYSMVLPATGLLLPYSCKCRSCPEAVQERGRSVLGEIPYQRQVISAESTDIMALNDRL